MAAASSFLTPWSSFFVMVGSSAAALTGLMFVVITLVNGIERSARTSDGISSFSTPTVMDFCAALFISATLCAPWHSPAQAAVPVGAAGLFGVGYLLRVTFRTKRMTNYTPDFEDFVWYSVLPLVAYATVVAGAIALTIVPAVALFVLAAADVLLIFIGIRNAWDVVTYLAIFGPPRGTGGAG
jgi:hypothetical protein